MTYTCMLTTIWKSHTNRLLVWLEVLLWIHLLSCLSRFLHFINKKTILASVCLVCFSRFLCFFLDVKCQNLSKLSIAASPQGLTFYHFFISCLFGGFFLALFIHFVWRRMNFNTIQNNSKEPFLPLSKILVLVCIVWLQTLRPSSYAGNNNKSRCLYQTRRQFFFLFFHRSLVGVRSVCRWRVLISIKPLIHRLMDVTASEQS